MSDILNKIESADGFILASPTNFGSVTALFKRFMERLVPYGYWPWGKMAPDFRKKGICHKKAVLISSSAAPSLFGRLFFSSRKQLATTAETIGAKAIGIQFTGMISQDPAPELPQSSKKGLHKLATKLAA